MDEIHTKIRVSTFLFPFSSSCKTSETTFKYYKNMKDFRREFSKRVFSDAIKSDILRLYSFTFYRQFKLSHSNLPMRTERKLFLVTRRATLGGEWWWW